MHARRGHRCRRRAGGVCAELDGRRRKVRPLRAIPPPVTHRKQLAQWCAANRQLGRCAWCECPTKRGGPVGRAHCGSTHRRSNSGGPPPPFVQSQGWRSRSLRAPRACRVLRSRWWSSGQRWRAPARRGPRSRWRRGRRRRSPPRPRLRWLQSWRWWRCCGARQQALVGGQGAGGAQGWAAAVHASPGLPLDARQWQRRQVLLPRLLRDARPPLAAQEPAAGAYCSLCCCWRVAHGRPA